MQLVDSMLLQSWPERACLHFKPKSHSEAAAQSEIVDPTNAVTAGLGGAGAAVLLLVVLLLGSKRDVTHSRSTAESPLLRLASALSVTGHFACTYTMRIRIELMRTMSDIVKDFSLAGCVLLSSVSLYCTGYNQRP